MSTEKKNFSFHFDKSFSEIGKQGFIGTMEIHNNDKFYKKCVYKISQCIDFLIEHECIIGRSINSIISYAPNFVKMLGSFNANVDLNFKKKYKTIFDVQTKNPISSKVILYEHINGQSLYDFLKENTTKNTTTSPSFFSNSSE